jgi:glycosyltransferase involved in cell wall biosynthesis
MNTWLHSIIIPTYNRGATITRALDSVLKQDLPGDQKLEIIVVDDGSNDWTRSIVESFWNSREINNTLPQSFLRQKYLEIPQTGVSVARNLGVYHSSGEWIYFLDSDDEWLPDKMGSQINYHLENREIKISQTEEIWIRRGVRVNPHKKHQKPEGNIFTKCLELCCITPSSACISRELWEKIGGFDPDLKACEDYDLWIRMSAFYPVGLIRKQGLIRYGGHSDQLSARYPVMDRFRIYSLLKFKYQHPSFKPTDLDRVLSSKLHILKLGLEKRNRGSNLVDEIHNGIANGFDTRSLLKWKEFLLSDNYWTEH